MQLDYSTYRRRQLSNFFILKRLFFLDIEQMFCYTGLEYLFYNVSAEDPNIKSAGLASTQV